MVIDLFAPLIRHPPKKRENADDVDTLEGYVKYNYPVCPLDPSFKMTDDKIPLESGEIHIIRFVQSNLRFDVFGLSFPMAEKAKYEYIKRVLLIDRSFHNSRFTNIGENRLRKALCLPEEYSCYSGQDILSRIKRCGVSWFLCA